MEEEKGSKCDDECKSGARKCVCSCGGSNNESPAWAKQGGEEEMDKEAVGEGKQDEGGSSDGKSEPHLVSPSIARAAAAILVAEGASAPSFQSKLMLMKYRLHERSIWNKEATECLNF